MNRFVPCPSCQRHVRGADPRCPFCDAAMPVGAAAPVPTLPIGRLSRIAILAAGASLIAAPACEDSTSKSDAGSGGTGQGGSAAGGAGGISGGTGGAGGVGTGGGSASDAGTTPDAPIAIYSAAIAFPIIKKT